MTRFFIGVASNQDAEQNIPEALVQIAKVARIVAISTFHETPAVGRPHDPPYTNGVIAIETSLRSTVVRRNLLKSIEHALGGTRVPEVFGPRPIDLDLLLEWVQRPRGRPPRPHPDVLTRFFVAQPLYEIAGDIRLAAPAGQLADHVESLPATPMRPVRDLTSDLRSGFLTLRPATVDLPHAPSHDPGTKRLGHFMQQWAHAGARRRVTTEVLKQWP